MRRLVAKNGGTLNFETCREWRKHCWPGMSPAKGLLAAVGVVVVAYCVDLTERGLGAGSLLSWCGLAAMGDGGSADLGGTSIIEVLEAACGGEGGSGAPGGEADQGVGGGGTATEETGKEAG